MKCTVCGFKMNRLVTDLPFKTTEQTIVILKGLPVLQCENCMEYLLQDDVMARVDDALANVTGKTELEVIRYAA